jgi:hypothetical protein
MTSQPAPSRAEKRCRTSTTIIDEIHGPSGT